MSATEAQFQFAAEFVTFLVGAGGIVLVVLRAELLARPLAAKVGLGLGFTALASGAFAHGSLLVDDGEHPAVVAARLGGTALVLAGSQSLRERRGARLAMVAGLFLVAGSVGVHALDESIAGDVVLAVGATFVGAALLLASRRSVAARVAASSAGTLLLVVLLLSVSLSTVLADTVEDEAVRRLDGRTATEVRVLEDKRDEAYRAATLAAATLASRREADLRDVAANPRRSAGIDADLRHFPSLFPGSEVGVAVVLTSRFIAGSVNLEPAVAVSLAGGDVVSEALQASAARTSLEVVGGRAIAVGVQPVFVTVPEGGSRLLALVVGASVLDDAYLAARAGEDEDLAVGLVAADGTLLARSTPRLAATDLRALAQVVSDEGSPASATTDDRFLAARPVLAGDGRPVMALVGATPTTLVAETRDSLARTLFLIALGGTLLALLLAALVGERIGAGLRRLTAAAEGIQRGELGTRAGIDSDDEVGVLGATFDSMAGAIEETTAALRQAADDETRLRNRLEAVVAGMGEALVAVDAHGLITDFNRAAEELVGVPAAAAAGRPVGEVVVLRSDGDEVAVRLAAPSPQRWSALASLAPARGTEVPVAVSSGALRGPADELVGAVYVLRDLRKEHEVERMKSEFLSRIGHELRTPLTGIIGYSEMLTHREVPPDRARVWHEEILRSGRRLERIIQLLEFVAATSAGRMNLRVERIELRSVVDEVVARWEDRLDEPYSITRRVARGLPAILGDRRWVTTALDELVDNAVKFSPNGGRVQITAGTSDHGWVELAVTDRGKGMSEDELAAAFGDFVQGDASDTRAFGGLGLGLALVKRVAESHGGRVTCSSEPGKGTRLGILLPTPEAIGR